MTIYLAAYSFYLFFAGFGLTQRQSKPWVILGVIPMMLLVFLRGNVGIDTPKYVQSVEFVRNAETYLLIFEPGFEYLILLLSLVFVDEMVVIKIIAGISTAFLLATRFSTPIRAQVISLVVIPYYYLDMTMNGLRYGLAFAMLLFSIDNLVGNRNFRFAAWTLLSVSMQATSLYVAGLLHALFRPSFRIMSSVLLVCVILGIVGAEYILEKVQANSELSIASPTAGLAPLLLSLLCLLGCWSEYRVRKEHLLKILILFSLTFLTYAITQVSYAGLRFQQLNFFAILLFIICAFEVSKVERSRSILFVLVIACLFGTAFRLNNFSSEAGLEPASFVPYRFSWEE